MTLALAHSNLQGGITHILTLHCTDYINSMDYYLSIRDIQTLGMLSCVLGHHLLPESFKPPKISFKPEIISSSKSFTFGSSPSYNDAPLQVSMISYFFSVRVLE